MYRMRAVLPSGRIKESKTGIAEYASATESSLVLYALRDALQRMNYACSITVHTECVYIRAVIEQRWLEDWEGNGWKNSKGGEVKDSILWQQVYRQLEEDGHELRVEAGKHEFSGWMRWQMPLTRAYQDIFRYIDEKDLYS